MAETVINTTDKLTRQRWSKELFRVVQKAFEFNSLVGPGEDAIIQRRTELGKGEGDTITFGILLDLEGTGTVGRDTLEGKAEALRFRDFKATIEKIRKSVDIGTDIDQQRVPYNLMQKGKMGLQNWWANFLSDYMFHVLAGNSEMVSGPANLKQLGGKSFGTTPSEPDANHMMIVNEQANEASLTSSDILTLAHLDAVKQRAKIPKGNNFKMRPIIINGKEFYRVILHDYVFDNLRRNTNIGEWGDMARAAQKMGDPITEIVYNGMMVSKSERVISRSANTYRNLFLGAQAAVVAWGGAGDSKSTTMRFHTETYDHGARTEVSGGGILGMAKTHFKKGDSGEDHGDYGCIVMPSYAKPLADS